MPRKEGSLGRSPRSTLFFRFPHVQSSSMVVNIYEEIEKKKEKNRKKSVDLGDLPKLWADRPDRHFFFGFFLFSSLFLHRYSLPYWRIVHRSAQAPFLSWHSPLTLTSEYFFYCPSLHIQWICSFFFGFFLFSSLFLHRYSLPYWRIVHVVDNITT
jgi:hypothetical protein